MAITSATGMSMSTTRSSSASLPTPSLERRIVSGALGEETESAVVEDKEDSLSEEFDEEEDSDDDSSVPTRMSDCLDCDDPVQALQRLSRCSAQRANRQAQQLRAQLSALNRSVPELLRTSRTSPNSDDTSKNDPNSLVFPLDHPLHTVTACADSVAGSLTKIASGGSEASQEIRRLEEEKRHMDAHAAALERALVLRKTSDRAAQSTQGSAWSDAAEALQPWLQWKDEQGKNNNNNKEEKLDPRVRLYTGEYALQQLQTTYEKLQLILLQNYERAVELQDLQTLGQLTPILSSLRLEQEALRFYKLYLERVLETSLQQAIIVVVPSGSETSAPTPPYAPMGRVYNTAVATLRHHLPMVSHCLYKADGAAAILQLVHVQVEDYILPLLQQYQRNQQLARVARVATLVYAHLEERYTGRMVDEPNNNNNNNMDPDAHNDDGGFAQQIGTLADVDASLQEAATVLQHAETYCRFVRHTCQEVRKARWMRHEHAVEKLRRERERLEWSTGNHPTSASSSPHNRESQDSSSTNTNGMTAETLPPLQDLPILPASTPLDQALAELGGQYAAIERCLLLASMHRALTQQPSNYEDPRFYRPMSTLQISGAAGGGTNAPSTTSAATSHHSQQQLQTTLVDTCLFAARRGTQRAFATGHAGTASAVVNFTAECLTDVLVEVLATRAEEWGVHLLKPGEGLLVGSANYLTSAASQLMRQGGVVVAPSVVGVPAGGGTASSSAAHKKNREELERHQKQQQGLARACAVLNDLEVATHHTRQLELLLHKTLDKSYAAAAPPPPAQQKHKQHLSEELQQQQHEVEQLRMCVKALTPVADQMQAASDAAIESLESVLLPRIRSIVGDAVGSEASPASSAFMIGAATVGDRHRDTRHGMNYNLDEEEYNLLQLSEGYVARLCTLLDELVLPLQRYLAPRLWDKLLLSVVSTAGKRLEAALRKCQFTALGGLALDADMRDMLHYTKERLHAADSNPAIFKACPTLSRLLQVGQLLSVDDLEDVTDLIHSSKRKGLWDLKMDDVKAFLSARVEFDAVKVEELLRD